MNESRVKSVGEKADQFHGDLVRNCGDGVGRWDDVTRGRKESGIASEINHFVRAALKLVQLRKGIVGLPTSGPFLGSDRHRSSSLVVDLGVGIEPGHLGGGALEFLRCEVVGEDGLNRHPALYESFPF